MRVDLFDFDLPEDRIALRPAEPREAARLLGGRPGRRYRSCADHRVADLPALLRAGDVLVFNNTRVLPAQLDGRRDGPGATRPRIGVTLHKRLSALEWRAFARPARKLADGRPHRFRRGLRRRGARQGRGRRDRARLRDRRARRSRTASPTWPHAAAALYRLAPRRRQPRRAGLSDPLRRRAGRRRRADRRAAFHPGADAGAAARPASAPSASPCMSGRAPSCRSRPRTPPITACMPNGARSPPTPPNGSTAARAGGGRIVAVGTTSLRLLESAAAEDGRVQPVQRRHRDLHHPRLPLQGRRPADHQFPFAAIHPIHAGLGLFGTGHHAARLRPRHRNGLSLLFLWRCMPARRRRPDASTRMTPAFRLHAQSAGRRRAPRRDRDLARRHPHARLHAGRHGGDRQGDVHRHRQGDRRRHHPRQHLSSDAAAGRGARRAAGRPASLHELARPDPHRQRRLSGDVAGAASQDLRGGRHLPVAYRRLHAII